VLNSIIASQKSLIEKKLIFGNFSFI